MVCVKNSVTAMRAHMQVIELDDSLDEDALEDGREPATFEVKQGSILLALPAGAWRPSVCCTCRTQGWLLCALSPPGPCV